jgi:hypothetical protein
MIEPPEPPHPHHAGRHWFDICIALAVLLVSAGSLLVSLHTGRTMEKLVEQNARLVRANSMPLLQWDTGTINEAGGEEFYLAVGNVGTGPARIAWFEIRQDGRVVRDYRDLLPPGTALTRSEAGLVTGGVAPSMMPAGERRKLLSWPRPPPGAATAAAWEHAGRARYRLSVEACYCSLFDECWRTRAAADVPQPVARCDARGRVSYQG